MGSTNRDAKKFIFIYLLLIMIFIMWYLWSSYNYTDIYKFFLFYSGAAYLISSVSIDLSKYALDICKNTVGQLRAKEELHRQEATLILKNLAHQCSDPGAMEELINYLFAVLNGKDLLNILYQTIFWLTMFLCTM